MHDPYTLSSLFLYVAGIVLQTKHLSYQCTVVFLELSIYQSY
jgi:hypothetical protein